MRKLISIFIAVLGVAHSFPARATKIVGNGGDRHAIEFVSVAVTLSDALARGPVAGIDLDSLKQMIEDSEVGSTTEDLVLDGEPKDAINYPDLKKIIFNRAAWDAQSDYLARATFVLHEYLGLMRVPDKSYQVSRTALRGLWFISGTDAETLLDVLEENQFAVETAVHGVTRMADANEITCRRLAIDFSVEYQCSLSGPGTHGKTIEVALKNRKARELWTLLIAFRSPSCGAKDCSVAIRQLECRGENTRMDKPGICNAKAN